MTTETSDKRYVIYQDNPHEVWGDYPTLDEAMQAVDGFGWRGVTVYAEWWSYAGRVAQSKRVAHRAADEVTQ